MAAPIALQSASRSLPASEGSQGAGAAQAPGTLAQGWALLHEAGDAIADLAQIDRARVPGHVPVAPRDFALRVAAAGPARLALTERGIDDCAAALHCGLTALIGASEERRDITSAALTLWREFDHARSALLDLAGPPRALPAARCLTWLVPRARCDHGSGA